MLCRPDGAAARLHCTTHRSTDRTKLLIQGSYVLHVHILQGWRHLLASTYNYTIWWHLVLLRDTSFPPWEQSLDSPVCTTQSPIQSLSVRAPRVVKCVHIILEAHLKFAISPGPVRWWLNIEFLCLYYTGLISARAWSQTLWLQTLRRLWWARWHWWWHSA